MIVGKHPNSSHLAINVEEELPAWAHLSVQRFYCGSGVRRVMKHTIRDNEVERFIGKWRVHQIGLNDAAILKIARVLECRERCVRNIQRKHLARTIFGNKPGVEAGPGPTSSTRFLLP